MVMEQGLIWLGLGLFGMCAGALTAAGYFALITSVGMINRAAAVTGTTKAVFFYEECLLFGAVAGTILSVFEVSLPLGDVGLIIYGLFAGMFVGLLVVSLAETLKALPIFIRRVRIGSGLGIVILMVGLGKAVGHLVYYLLMYD
jgi:stage V sporulation protein AB